MVQYERPYQVNVKHENQQKFMSTAYIFQKKGNTLEPHTTTYHGRTMDMQFIF